jgi:subfamily B ATP-binding cassette protein HlyB/CyaB
MALNPQQEGLQIIALFERLYGPDFSQDPQVHKWLSTASMKPCAMGQMLTGQDFQPGYMAILLQGRIRALGKARQSDKLRTIMTFQPGAIWDGDFLHQEGAELRISSEEALLYLMPTDVVLKIPVLMQYFQELKTRFVEAKATQLALMDGENNSAESAMAHASPAQPAPAPIVSARRKSQDQYSDQAWDCLGEVNRYYLKKPMAGRRASDPGLSRRRKIRNMQDFQKQLEFMQFQIRTHHLNWQQLLNAPYPIIVQDPENTLHWVTGRQGNTLLEVKDGEEVRFFPNDAEETTNLTYEGIMLLPLKKKALMSFKSAFTPAWYFKLCTDNILMTSQMVLISILVQIFSLAMPLFYMIIFDKVFGHQNLSTLNVMAIGIIGILLFDLLIKQIRSHVLSYFLEHLDRISFESLAQCLFNLPLGKSGAYLNRGMAERFMEVSSLNQTIISTFLITSMDVIFSVIVLFFLMSLNVQMALISVAPLIPMGFMYFWKAPRDKKKASQHSMNQRQCQMGIREMLEHNESVQALNAGHVMQEKIFDRLDYTLEKGYSTRYNSVNESALQGFIMTLGSMVMLYCGALMVINNQISYGAYMAINMLSRNAFSGLQRLFTGFIQLQQVGGLLDQFKALVEEEIPQNIPGHNVTLNQVAGAIELRDLSFRYDADLPLALKDINLSIAPGEKVILTGASGAGKTTLIRLLQKLYAPSSGAVYLDGINITDIDVENLRRHVGVAPQKPSMFYCSIRDNIALGNVAASQRDIWEAVSVVKLDADLSKKPEGLDTMVAHQGLNLSGGEIARISLARLFLLDPSLLIFDEALAPCEPVLRVAIYNYVFNHYRTATCIFVNDDAQVHQVASRIIVLNNGKVVEQGTYQQLMELKGYYFHLHSRI